MKLLADDDNVDTDNDNVYDDDIEDDERWQRRRCLPWILCYRRTLPYLT